MTSRLDDGHRRLVPRWRYTARTIVGFEHAGDPQLARRVYAAPEPVAPLVERWSDSMTLATASDAICAAIVAGDARLVQAPCEWLIGQRDVPPELLRAATRIVSPQANEPASLAAANDLDSSRIEAREIIRNARRRLVEYPRNTARWLDLARAHTVLGHRDAAQRAMNVAITLAPDHRVVLRAAVRLLIHIGSADAAQHLLVRHPRTRTDPWLLSQEISLAEILQSQSRYLNYSRKLLAANDLPPGHLTELASAVGTLDGRRGDLKRSRKLHRYSLIEPTDNVLAQVGWLRQADPALPRVPVDGQRGTFEAEVWVSLMDECWDSALEAAYRWHADEPYSARPSLAGSFIATSILDRQDLGIAFANAGLLADPFDPLLRNNLAVALARSGLLNDAKRVLAGAKPAGQLTSHVYHATQGLIHVAGGDHEAGAQSYREAHKAVEGEGATLLLEANWLDSQVRWCPEVDVALERSLRKACERTSETVPKAVALRALSCLEERRRREMADKLP